MQAASPFALFPSASATGAAAAVGGADDASTLDGDPFAQALAALMALLSPVAIAANPAQAPDGQAAETAAADTRGGPSASSFDALTAAANTALAQASVGETLPDSNAASNATPAPKTAGVAAEDASSSATAGSAAALAVALKDGAAEKASSAIAPAPAPDASTSADAAVNRGQAASVLGASASAADELDLGLRRFVATAPRPAAVPAPAPPTETADPANPPVASAPAAAASTAILAAQRAAAPIASAIPVNLLGSVDRGAPLPSDKLSAKADAVAKAEARSDAGSLPAGLADAAPAIAKTTPVKAVGPQLGEPSDETSAPGGKAASPAPAKAEAADAANASAQAVAAPAAATPQALAAAHGPAITSQVAAQIAHKAAGGPTRFDIALDPAGLGHVDVKIQIDAGGRLTAQLSFDNPAAAAEAKSRAGDLQQALTQAGVSVSPGGISFDASGQGFGLARQDDQGSPHNARPHAGLELAEDASPIAATEPRRSAGALDITI